VIDSARLKAAGREHPLLAVTVNSRPRQEADVRCTSRCWPRSAVGEVRKLALPATSSHTTDQEIAMPMSGSRVEPT
jgi:hypothetical protein